MNFIEDYPNLFQFFSGYFSDADLFGLSDIEAIRSFVSDVGTSEEARKTLKDVQNELISLISHIDFYWRSVSSEANRYFVGPEDTIGWLRMVSSELSKLIE